MPDEKQKQAPDVKAAQLPGPVVEGQVEGADDQKVEGKGAIMLRTVWPRKEFVHGVEGVPNVTRAGTKMTRENAEKIKALGGPRVVVEVKEES